MYSRGWLAPASLLITMVKEGVSLKQAFYNHQNNFLGYISKPMASLC